MMEELVTLSTGSGKWTAWERISVSASAKEAARAFAATVSDDYSGDWTSEPGDQITITANGDPVLTGYLEIVDASFDAKSHKIEVSGRSKGGDTIDSSVEHPTGEIRNKTILGIAQELDKQGVGFTSDVPNLQKVSVFRINPAETVFQAVERLCRDQHLIMQGMPDGSIKITKGASNRVNNALIDGVNILSGGYKKDASQKHSSYKVLGQRAIGSKLKGSIQINQESKDSSVNRNRPRHIISETDTDDGRAQTRADRERNRAFGYSISAQVNVQGWHDDNGVLWTPNSIVYVRAPRLKLDMDLLIESVNYVKDASGALAQLQLVNPAAHDSNVGAGKRTSPDYSPGFTVSGQNPMGPR